MIVIHVVGSVNKHIFFNKLKTDYPKFHVAYLSGVFRKNFTSKQQVEEYYDAAILNELEKAKQLKVDVVILVGSLSMEVHPHHQFPLDIYSGPATLLFTHRFFVTEGILDFMKIYYHEKLNLLRKSTFTLENPFPDIDSSQALFEKQQYYIRKITEKGYVVVNESEFKKELEQFQMTNKAESDSIVDPSLTTQTSSQPSSKHQQQQQQQQETFCIACGSITKKKCPHCEEIYVCSESCRIHAKPVHDEYCTGTLLQPDSASLNLPIRTLVIVGDARVGRINLLVVPHETGLFELILNPLGMEADASVPQFESKKIFLVERPVPFTAPVLCSFKIPSLHGPEFYEYWSNWGFTLTCESKLVSSGAFKVCRIVGEEKFNIMAWSCHQPFDWIGRRLVREDSQKGLDLYASVVEKQKPCLILGMGDSLYNDAEKAFTNVVKLLNDHARCWFKQPESDFLENLVFLIRRNYQQHWSLDSFAKVLSSAAHLFTWDDHENMDGVGSESDVDLKMQMFRKACHRVAWEFLFQMTETHPERQPLDPYTPFEFYRERKVGPLALWLFDSRSKRKYTEHTMISAEQMNAFAEFLQSDTVNKSELLVLGISVPLIYLKHTIQNSLAEMPNFMQSMTKARDDIRDSWRSPGTLAQLSQLINLLRNLHQRRPKLEFLILSGDIHVANAFTFQPTGFNKPLLQVTSSGLSNNHRLSAVLSSILVIDKQSEDPVLGHIKRQWPDIAEENFFQLEVQPTQFVASVHYQNSSQQEQRLNYVIKRTKETI